MRKNKQIINMNKLKGKIENLEKENFQLQQ